jgi:ABC-type sugar transport system ATPase subunit
VPVLYVTHDLSEARLLGDRFYAMVRGVLFEASSAEEAFDRIGTKVA